MIMGKYGDVIGRETRFFGMLPVSIDVQAMLFRSQS